MGDQTVGQIDRAARDLLDGRVELLGQLALGRCATAMNSSAPISASLDEALRAACS